MKWKKFQVSHEDRSYKSSNRGVSYTQKREYWVLYREYDDIRAKLIISSHLARPQLGVLEGVLNSQQTHR